MNRWAAIAWIGIGCMVGAYAQTPSPQGVGGGEERLRQVGKQLNLTEQQQKQFEALITVYQAELDENRKNHVQILRQMQEVLAQVDAAKADGDTAKVQELQAKLATMGPESSAEANFYQTLEQSLTPEQKAKLPKLRADSKAARPTPPPPPAHTTPPPPDATPPGATPPSPPRPPQPPQAPAAAATAAFRPAHVLSVVLELKLSADQRKLLENMLGEFREGMRTDPPRDTAGAEERTNQFIQRVRPLLTADQATTFDQKIEVLRENPPTPAQPEPPKPGGPTGPGGVVPTTLPAPK